MELSIRKKVFLNETFSNQKEVFKFLANKVVESGYADDETAVISALHKREKEGSTGMMDGFAIPHAKSKSILQASIVMINMTTGLEWKTMDNKPIDFIVALFIPEEEKGKGHLTILSQVAKMLMKETVRERLRYAQTESEIDAVLNEYIIS